MEEQRCYGCMNIKKEGSVCERCGFDDSCQNESHQLPLGTVLNERYLIGKVLGQGGFGIVYLGWDLYQNMQVTVKEYFPGGIVTRENTTSIKLLNKSEEEEQMFQNSKKRFMREAEILAQLSDIQEIVRVTDCFFANHTVYLVMEYIQGITLKQYVKERGGKLMAEEAFELLHPVMKALDRIHRLGIIHRDVSPNNIMLLSHGGIKLLDFGIAKDVGKAWQDKELTRPTEAVLKEGYAPVEQYQTKGRLGPWTDVYALCATLFYCMTGEEPPAALERLLGKEEISFIDHGARMTEETEQILCHGMAIRSSDRISSMDELYKELFGMSADVSEEQITSVPAKKKGYILTGMIAACILLCAGVFSVLGYNRKAYERADAPDDNKMYSGKCGKDVYWEFDPHTKRLTLSGTGETYYYCQDEETRRLDLLSADGITEEWIYEGHADFYKYADSIEEIVIEEGITSVNQRLFADLTSLRKVDFGSIEVLGNRGGSCFEGSSLKSVELPDTLTVMDEWSLAFCEQLETVSIPDSVESVGAHCFAGSLNLKTVTFGKEVILDENLLTGSRDDSYSKNVVYCGYSGSSAERNAQEYGIAFRSIGMAQAPAGQCGEHIQWKFEEDKKTLALSGEGEMYYYLTLRRPRMGCRKSEKPRSRR